MAVFETALAPTLQNEGGWVNDDADSGKETYRGISRANFPNWKGWAVVEAYKPMKTGHIIADVALEEDVKQFYRGNFWNVVRGDEIINQNVANDLFDKAVNMGTHQAIVLCQRSIEVEETGTMDDATINALNTKIPFA